ncbi:alpha-galactosidase [Streptomyces odontomachi]|uniref:alpha-galactosidase n=1 Tax=Streptomyces odontomachi TaxID=2944940 RepID=UPI002109EFA5|nr:alpha-galactosidase [Streptomyces sp. ODS25]
MEARDAAASFDWGHGGLHAEFRTAPDGTLRLVRLDHPGDPVPAGRPAPPHDPAAPGAPVPATDPDASRRAAALPLVEVLAIGWGSSFSGQRGIDSALGARLRHRGHRRTRDADGWHRLTIDLHDPDSGLAAHVHLASPDGLPVLRTWVDVSNEGTRPIVVQSVSSLALGGLPAPEALDVHWARNDWLAECRWQHGPLRDRLVDVNRAVHDHDTRCCLAFGNRGSWSTDGHLPMGALTERATGRTWLWQIESGTGWHWETGERAGGSYLALFGPDDARHQWRRRLDPGASFSTVPAALALSRDTADGGFDAAAARLTTYRRSVRRPHPDHRTLPVIFNDYMNTLMGDPTTERLLPLIDAASEVGAEYFVIDAGWYDDNAGWWDGVGAWEASRRRFPGGIHEVLDRIRDRGMVPGLWLEPEVVGVRSPVTTRLPDEAFFQRDGVRITEHGRHHLDLRHPAAVAHLDRTVDRIVADWGVGYLKLDYNVSIAPGTDTGGRTSPGAGLLAHSEAYRTWLTGVLDRHPDLVLENCASGGMRMDHTLLSISQVQSTSDQQDPLAYPPIAAAAPTAVAPEQAAVWAYPQPEFSDDEIAFTLTGALLGRVHLSGHLDRMSPAQRAQVKDAMTVYKALRPEIPRSVPFWPLGLPGWTDPWLALGLRTAGETGAGAAHLAVWRRGGPVEQRLPLPRLRGRAHRVDVLHPSAPAGTAAFDTDRGELVVSLPRAPYALLLRLTEDGG